MRILIVEDEPKIAEDLRLAVRSPRKALQRAGAQVLAVGGKLLGVLINDVDLEGTAYGYGGYYGYYDKYFDAAADHEKT